MFSYIQNIFYILPFFDNPEAAHHNPERSGQTYAQGGSRPATDHRAEEPIYFYDSDKPYYESVVHQ